MKPAKEQCFDQLLLGRSITSDGWLNAMRGEALEFARALQFPSDRHDDWRFTDLSSLYSHSFQTIERFAKLSLSEIEQFLIPGAIRLVFVDGSFSPELSDLSLAKDEITLGSVVERLGDPAVEQHFGRQAACQNDAFVALNTNFFEDGAWLHVRSAVTVPVHLLHIATKRDNPAAIYPRNTLVLEPNTHATVVEEYVGLGAGTYLSDSVTEVLLKDGARLRHARVQRESPNSFHFGHCSVSCHRDSAYESTSLAFGGRVSRHDLRVRQHEPGVHIHLNGLAVVSGRQIADTHTRIDHASPYGTSVQLHKCIADGAARGVFSGKVVVSPGSVGTDSVQTSRNLLLSDKAHIDAQPQLEIFNDDVSCKHGATIGQIDADALFFLKSRGLNEKRARSLLTHAFAAEIVGSIPVSSLAHVIGNTMLNNLGGGR